MDKIKVKYTYWLRHFGEYYAQYLDGDAIQDRIDFAHAPRGFIVGLSLYGEKEVQQLIEFVKRVDHVLGMFTGSDIQQVGALSKEQRTRLDPVFDKMKFCTVGSFMSKKECEDTIRRSVEIVRMPVRAYYACRPFPEAFEISFRCTTNDPDFYGYSIVAEAARRLPDVKFHVHHVYGFKPDRPVVKLPNMIFHEQAIPDMDAHLSQVSCALRFTKHDTWSAIPIEAMMAGRFAVANRLHWEMPYITRCQDDPEMLAKTLTYLRDIRQHYPNGYTRASEYFHKYHSPEQFVEAIHGLLES